MAKSDDILKKTADLLSAKAAEKEIERTRVERERQQLVTSLGQEIARIIAPAINNLAQSQQVTFSKMRQMLREIKVEAPKIPPINIPEIKVPQPRVQVNVPDVKVPQFEVPKPIIEFPASMQVTMDQYDSKRPLPVMMMGTDGKPMSFSMGASGGKGDFFNIKDIKTSTGASLISDAENALRVTGAFTVTGSATSTLAQLTNADGVYYDSDNPLPTTASVTLSADTGSGEIGADTLRIVQATDAVASVYVTGANGTIATYQTDSDGNYRDTFPIEGDIGTVTAVTGITNSVATYPLNSDGTYRDTQPVEGTVTVSSITASTAVALVDSGGVQYSTSNPVPIDDAGGSLTVDGTVAVSGVSGTTGTNVVDSSGVAYSGSNPIPTVAKTVNVRGSMATAYATISSDAATTLRAGVASTYLDMVYVMGANHSDGAVTLDFYTGAGGSTMLSLEIPANSTAGVAPVAPIPMSEAAQAWYVYYADSDVTGTTVDVTALFSKEV